MSRVSVLENMTMQEQIREMTCGTVIVAGVHGAGLQWTTLWQHTGSRSALIEWGWQDWETVVWNHTMQDGLGAPLAASLVKFRIVIYMTNAQFHGGSLAAVALVLTLLANLMGWRAQGRPSMST